MAIEVFNRYEKKYMVSEEIYEKIKPLLEEHMEMDEFSRSGDSYTICNIYYDTNDNEIIRKSIEKPIYKEKFRMRSYGVVNPKDKVYLEIKKKFKGCVNKRRTAIELAQAYRYLETKEKPGDMAISNAQILNEIDYMLQKYPTLHPAIYLSYNRNAMFGKEDRNFRITFDRNILTRRYDLGLDYGIYGDLLLPQGLRIMEVKVNYAAPLWLVRLLSEYAIYPVSYSKYGMEYKKYLVMSNKNITTDAMRKCI